MTNTRGNHAVSVSPSQGIHAEIVARRYTREYTQYTHPVFPLVRRYTRQYTQYTRP